ncbi:hypothetical protein L7F22_055985 [Adiantum nelumboides]|nr:hypothetical protein [Adiantum nelumboides]
MVGKQGSVDDENGIGAKRVATVWAPAQAGQPLTDLDMAREAIAQFQAFILEGGVLTVEEISSSCVEKESHCLYQNQRRSSRGGNIKLLHQEGITLLVLESKEKFQTKILKRTNILVGQEKIGLNCMDVDASKKMNKNKKLVKKLPKKYHAFLASKAVIKQIPLFLGPGINKAGKFPTLVSHQKSLEGKLLCMGVAVGNLEMEEKQLFQNVQLSVNFLVSLLKNN